MLTVELKSKDKMPLYEQLYLKIRGLITEGELAEGEKLPSERGLAANLQISRNTVTLAYEQLYAEGYVEVRPQSGYYVNKIDRINSEKKEEFTDIKNESVNPEPEYEYDFSPFSLCKESFPYRMWDRLYRQCMRDRGEELFNLGERQGDMKLRVAIAKYLFGYRGLSVKPENMIIGAGTGYLLQLLEHLIDEKSIIAMENPTYMQAYRIFSSLNRKVYPINLDENGLKVEELKRSEAKAVYLTPSHQFPTGVVMPIKRRKEILGWASGEDRYIIEDDHDSEFRYKGLPIPPLKAIDTENKVVYLGTFSRTIAPAIRIGFMVLPDGLLKVYRKKLAFLACTVPRIDQAVLTEFILGGHYERHINKARKIYKSRHDKLISSLKVFGDKVKIMGGNAGMHLMVKFKLDMSEEEVVSRGEKSGIKLVGLSKHRIGENPEGGEAYILIGYGNISEDRIEEGIKILAKNLIS
ncbi:MocR-like pyridoxine biosynthesis transcription factor PdxR [Catonella massiliensis]|uniref:PLP-dependent aminotransferase family protein n=1 Tax=Catonella massiliensis TaxID=2799636 RepID=A0ABS1J197_9FIRM|nr:PLP-dependent aminotransferase family protein [Catonella massiliensis]MBK5897913.1 PLP-dependent aminotransferase family protein [Catonella massiliensis]